MALQPAKPHDIPPRPPIGRAELHSLIKNRPHALVAVQESYAGYEALNLARQLHEMGGRVGLLVPSGVGEDIREGIAKLVGMGCETYELGKPPEGLRRLKGDLNKKLGTDVSGMVERRVPFPYIRNQMNTLEVKKGGKASTRIFFTPIMIRQRSAGALPARPNAEDARASGAPAAGEQIESWLRAQSHPGSEPHRYCSAFGDGANVVNAGKGVFIVGKSVERNVEMSQKPGRANRRDALMEAKDGGLRFHKSARAQFGLPEGEFIVFPKHEKWLEGSFAQLRKTHDLDMFMAVIDGKDGKVFLRDESLAKEHPEEMRKIDERVTALGHKIVEVPLNEEQSCPTGGIEFAGAFVTNPKAKETIHRLKAAGVNAVPGKTFFENHLDVGAMYHCITY